MKTDEFWRKVITGFIFVLIVLMSIAVPMSAQPDFPEIQEIEENMDIEQNSLYFQNGKPIIRLFSTSWCPHCTWIKETFDKVVDEYVKNNLIVAYHWDIDTGDNLLTDIVETEVPKSEINVLREFNSRGSIPTFIFGDKYFRVGNGYERQDDLAAEEIEFKWIINNLIKNEEIILDEKEGFCTFLSTDVSSVSNSNLSYEDECECDWEDISMNSADGSGISSRGIASGGNPAPCEENGCGPQSWKFNLLEAGSLGGIIAGLLGLSGAAALLAAVAAYAYLFSGSCRRHDYCYCAGETTYGKTKKDCDDDFLKDNIDACEDTFCWCDPEDLVCCEYISYGLCYLAANAFYLAVSMGGDGAWTPKDICWDYDNWEDLLGPEYACPPPNPSTVYVDGSYTGTITRGTEPFPFKKVNQGVNTIGPSGTVFIKAGTYPENIYADTPMTLVAEEGSVVIVGQ